MLMAQATVSRFLVIKLASDTSLLPAHFSTHVRRNNATPNVASLQSAGGCP
jgi:hypothetical protein